jgi:hypothetical protein
MSRMSQPIYNPFTSDIIALLEVIYMKRISIFFIMVALIAGMVGCASLPVQYDLTISSTVGGSVPTPGEGTRTYDEGMVVHLVAEAEEGYQFVEWTGDVESIANVEAASSNITMSGNYSITAKFVKQYNLTIASTAGGSVTTPGEAGPYTYDEGTVVNLVAEAEEGCKFVKWTGDVGTINDVDAAQTTITTHRSYSITANFEREHSLMVAAGAFHTVGLKSDGTLVAVGYREYGQSDVGSWMGIIQVVAGRWDTLGLKSDGTVVSGGWNEYGQLNVGDWTDITQVATSFFHTVGLKSDGTVVAVGENWAKQCDLEGWTGIMQVAAGGHHTVGLKSDGTVVAVGWNEYGQCDVDNWTDIIRVAAGYTNTVGIKSDGTVVAVGRNNYGQLNVGGWTDIVQVVAGNWHTVGLKSNGTVVTAGWNEYGQCDVGNWTDIIQIGGSFWHTVGVKLDGTVVAVGENGWGQCNVGDWMLIV